MQILSVLFMLLALSACAPRPLQSRTATPFAPGGISGTATSIDPIAGQAAELAVKDLSTRLGLDPSLVSVLSIKPMNWTDTALGCPRPGEVYPQQTVPGYLLRLEANGRGYIYHADQSGTVILCLEEESPSFPVTPDEIDDDRPWMPVD